MGRGRTLHTAITRLNRDTGGPKGAKVAEFGEVYTQTRVQLVGGHFAVPSAKVGSGAPLAFTGQGAFSERRLQPTL